MISREPGTLDTTASEGSRGRMTSITSCGVALRSSITRVSYPPDPVPDDSSRAVPSGTIRSASMPSTMVSRLSSSTLRKTS